MRALLTTTPRNLSESSDSNCVNPAPRAKRQSSARRLALALVGAFIPAAASLPGCGDDDGGGPGAAAIDTKIAPAVILLGQTSKVSCTAIDSAGKAVQVRTKAVATPDAPIVNGVITPDKSGTFSVACQTEDGAVKDPAPSQLVVLGPDQADLLEVTTSLSKTASQVGESVDVSCSAFLELSPLQGLEFVVEVTPAAGIDVVGSSVVGREDGDYAVACRIAESTFVDKTPETLVVGVGSSRPAKVVTTFTKNPIVAGESTEVICTVTDQNGKTMNVETFVESDEGVGVNGHLVEGRSSGAHEVTCRIADASAAVELVSGTLTVTPAVPKTLEVWVDPAKPVYKPADEITIVWEVKDGYGNIIADHDADITAPATNVEPVSEAVYRLLADGKYPFTVTLTGDSALSDTVEVLVDGSGPLIVITSPERGQTFDGNKDITVTGKVTDEWGGVKSLDVNGVPLEPDELGNFKTVVPSGQGLNLVVAHASDKHGNTGKASVAWYYSTEWVVADASDPAAATLPNALRVWMSQEILDDYDHAEVKCDAQGVCTPKIDDIATILEQLLTYADFAELLGKPVLFEQNFPNVIDVDLGVAKLNGSFKFWADISTIKFGTAQLNLDSRDGGIDVLAKLVPDTESQALEIGLSVHLQFDIGVTGEIDVGFVKVPFSVSLQPPPNAVSTATLTLSEVTIDSSFDISAQNGQLHIAGQQVGLDVPPGAAHLSPLANVTIELGSVAVSVAGLQLPVNINLGSIDLTQLVSGLDSIFSSILDPLLNGVLQIAAVDILDPLIALAGGELLESVLGQLTIDQDIALPELVPGQPPASVNLGVAIHEIQFVDEGGRIGLSGRAVAEKKVDRNPLGSILRASCLDETPEVYTLPQAGPMEVALGMDFINEILYGFWYAGGLNLALDGDTLGSIAAGLPLDGAVIALDPLLPPIMSDCNSKGTLRLQLGDAWIDASIPLGDILIDFTGYLSLELDVALVVTEGKLTINVNGISSFDLTVVEAGGTFANDPQGIEDLLKGLMNTLVTQLLGDALQGIEIPEIDLSGLAPGIPAGTAIALDAISLKKTKGFFQLEGGLK